MTAREELLALAGRVEQATGANRELDGSIAWAVGEFDRYQLGSDTTVSFYRIDRYDRAEIHVIGQKGGRVIYTCDILHYTASLDAAMSLVPEGATYSVERGTDGMNYANVSVPLPDGWWSDDGSRIAATPALALTAASLRARANTGDAS